MWKEFITDYQTIDGISVPIKTMINLAKVSHFIKGSTEVWRSPDDETVEDCIHLYLDNKHTIQVIEFPYEHMVQLIKNVPKNSPYYTGGTL